MKTSFIHIDCALEFGYSISCIFLLLYPGMAPLLANMGPIHHPEPHPRACVKYALQLL